MSNTNQLQPDIFKVTKNAQKLRAKPLGGKESTMLEMMSAKDEQGGV